jgi:hypothetical protein
MHNCVDMADIERAVDSRIPHCKPVAAILPVDTVLSAICRYLKDKRREETKGEETKWEAETMKVVTVEVEMQHIMDENVKQ